MQIACDDLFIFLVTGLWSYGVMGLRGYRISGYGVIVLWVYLD